jgi:hypothetical protein
MNGSVCLSLHRQVRSCVLMLVQDPRRTTKTRFVVGDLRFAMPQPPVPWTTPRNCTALPDACPQGHYLRKDYFGSEDCLFLDIYRPLGASETSNLPVMVFSSHNSINPPRFNSFYLLISQVYIHGGGFVEGSESS